MRTVFARRLGSGARRALGLAGIAAVVAPAAWAHNGARAQNFTAGRGNASATRKSAPAKKKQKRQKATGAPLCQATNLTVELPRDFLQLSVLTNSYIARDNSLGVINFQNFFPHAITEMAIVAEYQDQNGNVIFPAVFAASANPVTPPSWFSTYLPSQYAITPWTKPVPSGAKFTLAATSGITTAACPAQIKATVVHIAFAGGQALDYSTPGWELPTQPEQIPGDLVFYAPPRALPMEFTVKVHVPAPIGPIIPPPQVTLASGKPPELMFEHIQNQMEEWRFAFAIKNGQSVDGDQMLLIRVHSAKEGASQKSFWIAPDEIPAPMGVIDLVPEAVPDKWAVYYGGVLISSSISPPQME